jgi:glycosyltransferase involved in cell wall biosynthesis
MKTVVHFTDSHVFGGTDRVVLQTLGGLDRERWNPVLFHHTEPALEPLVERARSLRVATRSVSRMVTVRDFARVAAFARALRAEGASVFHAHVNWPLSCKYGLLAARFARVPAIVATAHLSMDISQRWLLRVQPRLIAELVDRYFAVSRSVADQLCGEFGIPAARVQVVPNGIALDSFVRPADASLRKTLSGESERPVVLTVASLEPRKGQRTLLEAATRVPEAVFVLVGLGPDRAALEAQARTLGIADRVRFLGYREDVPDLLASCDVFALPSLEEGLPLAILEAMGAAKPVVASDIGGNDEAVARGDTGLLVPPDDPEALATGLRAVLGDPALARRLGEGGRERARELYSVERMVRSMADAYRELLGSRAAAQAR